MKQTPPPSDSDAEAAVRDALKGTPMDEGLARLLIRKLTDEHEIHLFLKRRVSVLTWVAVSMLLIALGIGAAFFHGNYNLRADINSRDEEIIKLGAQNQLLNFRAIRLRSELAIRDARFLAAMRRVRAGGISESDLISLGKLSDEFAEEFQKNDANYSKTHEDARREACAYLGARGYPCD